ncbi:putative helicase mov-10-B.2, partial [Ctenocephalides felis]|uniref:putative helicase mov-10-B.2 n=1 Tax=Ctenocephalides felis TaxID=7515 RepID=UPI000E6E274B
MEYDQQVACSLCYFTGTEQEYEAHKTCALHGFNFILKYFSDKRSSIVKNRHGVIIETVCCNQNVSHMDNLGTNTITLGRNDINLSTTIELEYRIVNYRSKGIVYLRNVLQLHPQPNFKMFHKRQEHMEKNLDDNIIKIRPKREYFVRLTFSGPVKHISTYRMPLAFVFQIETERTFTLIREMVVVIEDVSKDETAEQRNNIRKIYTGKSWISSEIVPANLTSDLDKEYIVPKIYRKPILKFLKFAELKLGKKDLMKLRKFEKLYDVNGIGMTRDNYLFYCTCLMWMEEITEDRELRKYNMEAVTMTVSPSPMNANATLEVPGLAEKRPSLVVGDRAHVRIHQEDPTKYRGCRIYEGVISKVLDTAIEIDEFNKDFLDEVTSKTLVDVRFIMSRLRYQRIHRALSYYNNFVDRLFPRAFDRQKVQNENFIRSRAHGSGDANSSKSVNYDDTSTSICNGIPNGEGENWEISTSPKKKQRNRIYRENRSNSTSKWITEFDYMNKLICDNKEQKVAIENIVNKSSGIAPYILFGPPGTGKTVTIVEAIVQIIKHVENPKILVCAPANMACDMLTCKLRPYFNRGELIRIHSANREFDSIPKEIYPYSNLELDPINGKACGAVQVKTSALCSGNYKVVVCTLMLAGKYTKPTKFLRDEDLKFTHLVIDEAAQSMETETLIPLAGLLKEDGQMILAGDPKQLGPICQSHTVKNIGLGISLMERLMLTNKLYESKAGHRDEKYITKLVKNFRSHPDIIKIPNKFFYDNELQPCSKKALSDPIVKCDVWDELLFGGEAIEFYGVSASECRQGHSPSYFNMMEKDVVIKYVQKLLNEFGNTRRMNPPVRGTDIGIISPYIKQVYKIKVSLQRMGGQFRDIEVGSTEAFQGREKRIMIISTVRGRSELLEYDKRYNLGFLVDEKRFNVALTRAKSKLIIVGNPLCLTYNEYWLSYIAECDSLKRYLGYRHEKRNSVVMDYIERNLRKIKIREEIHEQPA